MAVPQNIKIIVTDDHPIVRAGLIAVIETQEDFEVIAEANHGKELLEILKTTTADVLLLDLEMPEMDGSETLLQLKQQASKIPVIVFTVFDTDERILTAIQHGAKGYLLKGASRQEIFQAIRTVHQGGTLLQPLITSKLMNHLSQPSHQLSKRELEVLELMHQGQTNKEIAGNLFISERTVKFHVSSILSKTGAQNRTQAVKIGQEKGWI